MINIALVDDHVIFRKSLAMLIDMLGEFKVVSHFNNGKELVDSLNNDNLPDIVLMDITMPVMDGVETTKWLKQNNYKVKVIALSMLKNDIIIIRMLKNGARGYLLKDCDTVELKQAINDVYCKGYYYNEFLSDKSKTNIDSGNDVMMNEKELAFLRLCCTDKSYKEIADVMCVSPRTVDGYRDALFQKLDVTSRVGLAIYAIKNNIVQI